MPGDDRSKSAEKPVDVIFRPLRFLVAYAVPCDPSATQFDRLPDDVAPTRYITDR